MPVFLPYGALINAAFSRNPSRLLSPETATLHNVTFTFFELSQTRHVLENTFLLAALAATLGTVLALVIAYLTARRPCAAIRRWGFSPPRRSQFLVSFWAWGFF